MKPMLAASKSLDPEALDYPVAATPKIDGIRCLTFEGGAAKSRTLKDIPNVYIRECIARTGLSGLDGELVLRGAETFGDTSGAIMRRTGEPDFEFCVFDLWDAPTVPYLQRVAVLKAAFGTMSIPWISMLEPVMLASVAELLDYEAECLADGHEGVIIRNPHGPYKYGRSTLREGTLLKLKRFTDSEAIILDSVEAQANLNEATTDAFGRTKRSSHKVNKVGKGTLGALIVRDCETGVEFRVDGFTEAMAAEMWDDRENLPGRIAKYKSLAFGSKEKPRHPKFLGIRHPEDMS